MFSSGGNNNSTPGSGAYGAQLISGLTGNSGAPYEGAMDKYQEWAKKAEDAQSPYANAGREAIPHYQQWLNGMKDPSGFINHLMGQYGESPWAKFQQQQAMRAAQNQGSASGLTGSTPLNQFAQQNARDISSQDQNQWLQNVLGINTQYGQGQNNLIGYGQNSANALTNMYGDMGRQMGEAEYGRKAGEGQDKSNIWGGLLGTAGTVVGSMYGGPIGGAAGGAIGSSIGNKFG